MSVVEAAPNQFPFLVGILAEGASASDGILISPEWVLTSASSLNGNSFVEISLGAHLRYEWDKVPQIKSRDMMMHENYSPSSLANNLGLIRLPNPVTLNAKVQPLTRLNRTENLIGQAAKSVGWGVPISNAPKSLSRPPEIVDASIVETQVATAYFGQQYNHPGQIAVDIGEAPITTSILITQGLNGWELVGLANYFGAGDIGAPGVYSRITYFEEWIRYCSGVNFD